VQLLNQLNLVVIFLIPVIVHVALRRIDREISRGVYVIAMAILFVLQLGLSSEALAEIVALGAVLLIAARLLADEPQRARVNGLAIETLGAGLLAMAVTSPYLYYALFRRPFPQVTPNLSDDFALDPLNIFFPTRMTWLGHQSFEALASTFDGEADAYLGVGIVVAFLAWFFTAGKRRTLGRLLAVAVAVSTVAALGAHLRIAGHRMVALPFNWVANVSIFNEIIPSRIILFITLATSIGIAAWLASAGARKPWRWLVVLAGAVLIFPNLSSELHGSRVHNPTFFATSTYRRYLKRDETVLILPYGHNDDSTLWQAETGFYFYMPEGYVSNETPAAFEAQPGVHEMSNNEAPARTTFTSFIREHEVSDVIVDATMAGPWEGLLASLGLHGEQVGDILLYHVPGSPA
jgi:hypothetical protein